jgi:hypothetical protein
VEQSVHLSEQGAARQPTGGLPLGLVGFELVSAFWWIACLLENRTQSTHPYITTIHPYIITHSYITATHPYIITTPLHNNTPLSNNTLLHNYNTPLHNNKTLA